MLPRSAIKLIRTDTTLDFSQKAEKGMLPLAFAELIKRTMRVGHCCREGWAVRRHVSRARAGSTSAQPKKQRSVPKAEAHPIVHPVVHLNMPAGSISSLSKGTFCAKLIYESPSLFGVRVGT